MTVQDKLHEPRLRKLAKIGFVVAALILLLFVSRLFFSIYYWSDADRQYQTLEPWMTIGYIARSHGIDRLKLIEQFPYNLEQAKRKSLKDVAAMNNVSVEEVIREINSKLEVLSPQRE